MVKNNALKNVSCTEISDCKTYSIDPRDRMVYDGKSPDNRIAAEHDDKFGIQQLMDKIRKIHGYRLIRNDWNAENKSFDAHIIENGREKEVRHFSYEQICDIMKWHSFEIVSMDTVKPDPLTYEEIEAIERPKVEAYNRRMKKWAKEHPEEAAKLAEQKAEEEKAIRG